MDKGRRSAGSDGRDRPQRRGFRGTAENAKTKICQRWQNGECRFGDRCNFAHGDDELRNLPPRGGGGGGGGGGPGPGARAAGARGPAAVPGAGGYADAFGPRGGPAAARDPRSFAGPRGAYASNNPHSPHAAANLPNGRAGAPSPAAAADHAAWVASGCPTKGPAGWTQYLAESGERYYHHAASGETVWDPPAAWPRA